jgi:ribokinase
MAQPRVIVVGSSNTDMIVRAARLPLPGETVLGGDLTTAAGGKGANQAVAAARLGAHVTFVGRIGQDMFGQQTLAAFQREGLNLEYLHQDADTPSGVALIVVGPGGQNIIAVAPGANRNLSTADVTAAQPAIAQARVMVLQLEIPITTVLAAALAARKAGLTVILNPAPAEALPTPLYEAVDVLTPNEHEAALLTGMSPDQPEAAAAALLGRQVGTVIVTLGEAGVVVARRGEPPRRLPGFRVRAVDSTAAGDAFNGALAVALARGDEFDGAVRYAQAVAAISVTRHGAQPSLPKADEVEQFLQQQVVRAG